LRIYGSNPVAEALRGRRSVRRIWLSDRADLPVEVTDEEITVDVLERDVLEELCGSPDHQGIVAEVEPYPYEDAQTMLDSSDALVVALDQVQDPQNLGAICRTAETAGVAGLVLPERRSVDVTPAVCKASAGAVEHLRIARVRNLADFLLSARKLGAWVYGADGAAPDPYTAVDFGGRAVIVLGGEAAGLRPRVRDACDLLVSIPMAGRTGSLNVSAAAAVLLYEARRQRAAQDRQEQGLTNP
jgi:23S rRNA (guanosine2251-2'-O)-methyltransferase